MRKGNWPRARLYKVWLAVSLFGLFGFLFLSDRLVERPLYRSDGLSITQRGSVVTLYFGRGSIRQSVVDLRDDWTEILSVHRAMIAFLHSYDISHLLLVGLGGGSVPNALRKRQIDIDAVEINKELVAVHRKHDYFKLNPRTNILEGDVVELWPTLANVYQAIVIDGSPLMDLNRADLIGPFFEHFSNSQVVLFNGYHSTPVDLGVLRRWCAFVYLFPTQNVNQLRVCIRTSNEPKLHSWFSERDPNGTRRPVVKLLTSTIQ